MLRFVKKANSKNNKNIEDNDDEVIKSNTKSSKAKPGTNSILSQSTSLVPEKKIISTPYTLKADLDLASYSTFDLPNPSYIPPLRQITGIRLTWLTAQEIENMATVIVRNPKLNGPGSVYDAGFGTIVNHEKCIICSQGWRDCPGHPGVIKLPYPIPHPVCIRRLADIITCFCEYCHRLVMTWKQMKILGILDYHRENRFNACLDSSKKQLRCAHCRKPHGKYMVIDDKIFKCYKKRTDVKFPMTYEEVITIVHNIRDQEIRLIGIKDPLCHPRHMIIYNLCVLPSSARPWVKGGGGQSLHDDLTHKYTEIVKITNSLTAGGPPEKWEKTKLDLMDDLMSNIKTLLDNSKGSRVVNSKRTLRALKQRISGKSGMVRMNIQGKRIVQCARSVISPDPDLDVREVGMPHEIAEKLSYPELVTKRNLSYCQKLLEDGQVLRIIITGDTAIDARYVCWSRGFKLMYGDVVFRGNQKILPDSLYPNAEFALQEGDSVLRCEEKELPDGTVERKKRLFKNVEPSKKKRYELKPGYIIERKIRNGDYVLFNRQPTLHEPSMRAKKIKIHNDRTLKMELSSTAAFGADFDGDEMNATVSSSENSRAEHQELLSTESQFISGADSRPMLQLKQDNIIGSYEYTLGRVPVPKHTFMDVCCLLGWDDVNKFTISQITDKIQHIKNVHRKTGFLETEIKNVRIENLKRKDDLEIEINKNRQQLANLKVDYAAARSQKDKSATLKLKSCFERVKLQIQRNRKELEELTDESLIERKASDNLLYTGHSLFSILFPRDFEFKYKVEVGPEKRPIRITRGVLLDGTINSAAIHHIIHYIYKNYGSAYGCDFVTYWQRFTNLLLSRRGFSVGLGDCVPKASHIIEGELEKAFLQAQSIENSTLDPEQKEAKVLGLLNNATNVGERIVREGVDPDNNFIHMIMSGSKGKMFNYVNSVSAVGQQNLGGKRAPLDCGNRSLPCYPTPDTVIDEEFYNLNEFESLKRKYQSRGFISNSFYSGLTSQEFFFLAAGGREGLIDTSIKTATCGYLSKRLLKSMEDVKVGYNGMVTNAKGSIIQFCYGDDNYAAPELIKTEKFGYQCADVAHMVETLHQDLEWNNDT